MGKSYKREVAVIVLTYCTHIKEETKLLEESLRRKEIPFEISVIPGRFSWTNVIEWQREKAHQYRDTKVIFVDAWDTLFIGDKEELEYQLSIKPTTFCGSKRCWPDEWKVSTYDKQFPHTKGHRWRFLNGGTMFGMGSDIYQAIDFGKELGLHIKATVEDGRSIYHQDNDQRFWTDIHLGSRFGEIDINCEVFQNLACVEDGEVGMYAGRFMNFTTGSFPQFIHAAAKTWDLIPKELYA